MKLAKWLDLNLCHLVSTSTALLTVSQPLANHFNFNSDRNLLLWM